MGKTYPCERVDVDFVGRAPYRFVSTVDLAITPVQLFEVLGDATSWPQWASVGFPPSFTRPSVIRHVEWTSPEPRGAGTTRTVTMLGGIVGDEEFLAWEPFTHMAFRFNESTTGSISAFAEDYRVLSTADGCHLTWVMAMKPNGVAGRLGLFLGRPVMGWMFQRFLHNLRRYTDARYQVGKGGEKCISTDPPTPSA